MSATSSSSADATPASSLRAAPGSSPRPIALAVAVQLADDVEHGSRQGAAAPGLNGQQDLMAIGSWSSWLTFPLAARQGVWRYHYTEGIMRRTGLLLVSAALCLACERRPEITVDQINRDLVGRSVGEGLSVWMFQKDEPRKMTLVETKRSGDHATVVIEVETEWTPPPMPSFPRFSPPPLRTPTATPWPTPMVDSEGEPLPTPLFPAFSPPPLPSPPRFELPPPPTLKWPTTRKWSGRLRLRYEWVAGEWNLLKIENLGFKPQ